MQQPSGRERRRKGLVNRARRVLVAAVPEAGQPLIAENDTARLIALNVDSTVLGALRDGMAVKLSMGDLGGLRLNLYKRRNAKSGGQAYELNPDGADAAPARQFWSLGGSLDLVRDTSGR